MTSFGVFIGMVEMSSNSGNFVVHCRDGGSKNWYGGNRLRFSTRNWGLCISGSTDTLVIERTSVHLKISKGDEVVFWRNLATTDGKCLLDAGFWRLANHGKTVVSAEGVLGKVHLKSFSTIVLVRSFALLVVKKLSYSYHCSATSFKLLCFYDLKILEQIDFCTNRAYSGKV